jgi:hypothetical protein
MMTPNDDERSVGWVELLRLGKNWLVVQGIDVRFAL